MTMAIETSVEEKLARFGLTERDVERLVESLGQRDAHARRVVRGALLELGEAAVPALTKGLTSGNPAIRQEAASLRSTIQRKF